jgi:autotransporter-associated beta strand protein
MQPTTNHQPGNLKMKTPRILATATAALFALSAPTVVRLAADTWSWNVADSGAWNVATNWDATPSFTNTADLIFNNAMTGNTTWLGAATVVRSLTFGSGLTTGTDANVTFDIQTRTASAGGSAANLSFQADSGNASLTVESGIALQQVRIGTEGNSSHVVLNSSLDIFANSATTVVDFEGRVSGSGAINKYGVGMMRIYRDNKSEPFSGGINIKQGTVRAWGSTGALGTGAVTIGDTDSSGSANDAIFSAGSFDQGAAINNNIVVAAGTGARVIENYVSDPSASGTLTISGGTIDLTAGKAVTINTGAGTAQISTSHQFLGTGGVVKIGPGNLQLWADNKTAGFSGAWTINNGNVLLRHAGGLGTGSVTLGESGSANSATLEIGNTATYDNTITVAAGDGARVIRNKDATITTTLNSTIDLSAGKTLTLNTNGGTITIASNVTGTGGIIKTGAGGVRLWSQATYTGATEINTGTLYLGGVGALNGGSVTIASGATLDVGTTLSNGSNSSVLFKITDAIATTTQITGAGTLSFSGKLKLDLSSVTASSGSWLLIDVNTLTESFTGTFAVQDNSGALTFINNGSGIWTSNDGRWSFTQATGTLALTGNIPEPATIALIGGLGILVYAVLRRRS